MLESGETAQQFGSTNFRYWADAVCDTFVDVDCRRTCEHTFEGKLDRRSLLDTRFVRVKATTHAVERHRDRIARAAGDFVLLSVMRKGSSTNTPTWSASAGIGYEHELASAAKIGASLDYTYKSNSYPDAENSRLLATGNVGLLNGAINFTSAGGRYGLTLGVQNITDKRFVVGGWDQTGPGQIGFAAAGYNPPRQWYLTLRVKS